MRRMLNRFAAHARAGLARSRNDYVRNDCTRNDYVRNDCMHLNRNARPAALDGEQRGVSATHPEIFSFRPANIASRSCLRSFLCHGEVRY
jgi:hypothetical protein